ncbi:predicted protein, partial [Haematococcus lacustris]
MFIYLSKKIAIPNNVKLRCLSWNTEQASAYKSGDVVKTLKKAFLPDDGSTTMTFADEDAVLNYIGSKVILPIWKDPVCGDGSCEYPWEFPAWGRFGCKAGVQLHILTSVWLLC